jgi:hypothetical protein
MKPTGQQSSLNPDYPNLCLVLESTQDGGLTTPEIRENCCYYLNKPGTINVTNLKVGARFCRCNTTIYQSGPQSPQYPSTESTADSDENIGDYRYPEYHHWSAFGSGIWENISPSSCAARKWYHIYWARPFRLGSWILEERTVRVVKEKEVKIGRYGWHGLAWDGIGGMGWCGLQQ